MDNSELYFFFDTETTGLPKDWRAPITDLNNWPRMIQIGYLIYDTSGRLLKSKEYLIRPEGFTIPEDAARIHGISTSKALAVGSPLKEVLEEMYNQIGHASLLIAHNMSFDEKILGAEFLRMGFKNPLPQKRKFCTMIHSTNFCAIPAKDGIGYKWPSLKFLYQKLFQHDFSGAHNALADIQATAACYWELKRRNLI